MTFDPNTDSASAEELTMMTEAGFAALRAEEGATVVERKGRFWGETFRGFYQPIHQIAEFRAPEMGRPTWKCWGYRAALTQEDAHLANGSIPILLMDDLPTFTDRTFDESRRRDLRRCRREVEIRRVFDPEVFVREGWAVYLSAKQRVPYGGTMSESDYQAMMTKRAPDPRRLIVAGFVDGKLAGYLESYAVDGILYGRDLFVDDEMMRTGIATGLYMETIQFGVRASAIDRICLGPVLLERPGLTWFKRGLGFRIVAMPARITIPAPINAFIRWRRPAVHYRLTGESPRLAASADGSGPDE